MATTSTCAHGACTCAVKPGEKFCSDLCRSAAVVSAASGGCVCTHPDCKAAPRGTD